MNAELTESTFSAYRELKVAGYETIVVDNVTPYMGGWQWLFVRLFTNDGIVGLGERPTGWAPDIKAQIALVHDLCDRFVVNQSPFNIELICQQSYGALHDYRHPDLYATPALSAIEMACWDIVGKATQQPIYNLLGGQVHDRLWAYSYLQPWEAAEEPALAAEGAVALLESGFTACKLDPFLPLTAWPRDFPLNAIRKAARVFEAIRTAVGDEMEIGIGTHGQFTTSTAIRVASLLEEYHPFFFEEPVSPENVEEMARVAAHTSIPIATGERLVTRYDFTEVLEKQAAQIIQLDVGQCGGILEAKKIAAIADTHYATIAPHMFCGPVAAAAAVQLATSCPNFLIQKYNTTPLHDEIVVEPLQIEMDS